MTSQFNRRISLLVLLVLLFGTVGAVSVQAQGASSPIQGYLFYSSSCDDCDQVRREVIQPLYREFGQRLQILAIDVDHEANYQWWLTVQKKFAVSPSDSTVPQLFMGDQALIGPEQITAQLSALVQKYADAGGVDYPDMPRPADAPLPTARFMFFFSPTCPHCQYVEENVFPAIKAKYGDRVTWESLGTDKEQNYKALLMLEEIAGVPESARGSVPVIFIGDEYGLYSLLVGSTQIPEYLEQTIDWFMGIGGVNFPEWKEELFAIALTPTANETPEANPTPGVDSTPGATFTPSPSDGPAIHMAYFTEVGCSECDRVSIALAHVKNKYPNLVVHEFDIINDLSLNLCLGQKLNVPENKQHDAPAIFVGQDFLVDQDIYYESLLDVVAKYAQTGVEPTWDDCSEQEIKPLAPPAWWAVIVPGLIDGINPCAFATIIFFVSYLAVIERKGREIIMVGISFVLSVFLSYLAFGMILREVLAGLVDLVGPVLRPILNTLMAVLCLLLAVLSFADYRKARRGRVKDMALRLPDRLRKWINATIRQSMKAEAFVTAAFAAGVIVSFIELACSGQVYVPIIQGLSNPSYRLQSTIALVVYCLAFVIPLIAVFIVSYLGTGTQQLSVLLTKYTATVKLLTALLFVGIGFWLIYDMLRIWGVF